MFRRSVFALAWLWLALTLPGMAPAADWRPVTEADLQMRPEAIGDPEADAAILFREGELNDNFVEGTVLRVYVRIKIFNDRGRRFADIKLPYRVELGRISDVEARTVRPDGSVVDVRGEDIFDQLDLKTARGVWRAKVFTMPAVEPGAIIEYRYRQTYPAGFRYFALDIQSELFTRELRYRIQPRLMSRFDVRWATFNAPDPEQFTPVWDGLFKISAENIPPFRREPMMPPELAVKAWGWLYYTDAIETDPEKYWREHARRTYDRLSHETRPTSAIRNVVETITLPDETPEEKIARIYSYVQSEIQNIGFLRDREGEAAADLRRNNSADETIRRRYGTPGEINRLFVAMLRAADLDARVAALVTRDENFFHRAFPDALQFNSEVTAVVGRDGAIQFYDPGTPYCPLGMLSWEKEAVPALIYGKRDWRFVETPITQAAGNLEERQMTVSLEADGTARGRMETRLSGQPAMAWRGELNAMTPDERKKELLAAARQQGASVTVEEDSPVAANLTDVAAPLILTHDFTYRQFAARTERRLLMRPALLSRREESLFVSPRRVNALYFPYPRSESERVVIEVPEGFEIEQLPAPVDIDIGAARYQASFTRQEGRVVYERRLMVNAITFKPEQYATVKEFFDRAQQADQAALSLRQR